MKMLMLALSLLIVSLGVTPAMSADIAAGKKEAAVCSVCHGGKNFSGIFYTLQLAGRNTDALVLKLKNFRSGKAFQPIMNLITSRLSDQTIDNIAAYYHSLGRPAFASPLFHIRGDHDADAHAELGTPGPLVATK
jgi:cytochrome c553